MKKQKKLKTAILNHIKNNGKDYVILVFTLIIGVVLGVMFINNISEEQKQEISSYITTFINSVKEEIVIDKAGLLKSSIVKNMGFVLCLWFIGLTVTLMPVIYAIILFRGFCIGYTISAAIGVLGIGQGVSFSLAALLLQNIFAIPAILALAMSGIRLYKAIMKDRRKENIKIEILRSYSIFYFNALNTCNIIVCRNICIFKSDYDDYKIN